jgi:hypothetical protein
MNTLSDRTQIFVKNPYFFFRVLMELSIRRSNLLRFVIDCWKMANPMIDAEYLPMLRPYDFRHSFASAALQRWINEG